MVEKTNKLFLDNYLNKRIKCFFDDGKEVRFKEGLLIGYDNLFIYIKNSFSNAEEGIPIGNVIRVEFVEEAT